MNRLMQRLNGLVLSLFITGFVFAQSATVDKVNMPTSTVRLAANQTQIQPLLLGSALPDAQVDRLDGSSVSLKQLTSRKPAVLVFYRGGWCPFCNLQLSSLQKITPQLKALGFTLYAISPDSAMTLREGSKDQTLDYELLSDARAQAMSALGIGYRVDDQMLATLKGYGIDIEKASGHTHRALPVPAVWIVDKQGLLQFSYIHPDYKVRAPGEAILAVAKAIADDKLSLKPSK